MPRPHAPTPLSALLDRTGYTRGYLAAQLGLCRTKLADYASGRYRMPERIWGAIRRISGATEEEQTAVAIWLSRLPRTRKARMDRAFPDLGPFSIVKA